MSPDVIDPSERCPLCKIGAAKHSHKAFYEYDPPWKPQRKVKP